MFIEKVKENYLPDNNSGTEGSSSTEAEKTSTSNINQGTLTINAQCAHADIAYPTDLELCDKAR